MYRKKYGEHVYLHWVNGLNYGLFFLFFCFCFFFSFLLVLFLFFFSFLLVLFLFFFGLFVCLLTTVIVQLSGSVNLRLWIKKMGFSI